MPHKLLCNFHHYQKSVLLNAVDVALLHSLQGSHSALHLKDSYLDWYASPAAPAAVLQYQCMSATSAIPK